MPRRIQARSFLLLSVTVALCLATGGLAFVGATNGDPLGLYAIDIDIGTGQTVWSTSTTVDQPIVVNGMVYSHHQAFALPTS